MEFTQEVEGMDDVMALFDKAGDVMQRIALAHGLQAAGNVGADAVEAATPLKAAEENGSNALDIGVLRENVSLRVEVDSQNRGGQAVITHGRYSYVAWWVEYGHRQMSHGSKLLRRFIKQIRPHPFVRPAAAKCEEEAIEAFASGMQEVLVREGVAVNSLGDLAA